MPRFFSKNISAYLGPIWSLVSPRDEALKNLKKDLKEAQARARRFEGMFQSLARATNHFVWMVDEELRFTYCNSAFKELLGYEPEELLGRKFTEFQPPERVEKDLRAAAQMIQSHSDFDYETELLHRDGTRLSVLANAVTLQDETGRTTGIIGISWNITAHKRLVEVLRRSEYGLARAQKISGIGSWDWDVRTREVNWSDEAYRVFGLDPRGPRIYFDRVLELVHPEDLERLSTAVEEAISGRQPLDIEHRVIWPDQSVHFLHQQGELLLDDDGRPFRMIGAVHDVTLQRAYEAGLVHAKEAADTANRLKSSFLANMSHELRTPLTAILGFTDLLKQSDDATENLKKFQWLETIRRNSKHLLTLIDDVLDLSKIEAGHMSISLQSIHWQEEVEHAIFLLQNEASRKNLTLTVEIAAGLPSVIILDALRLRQILINVVGNAIKFTATGGVSVAVGRTQKEGRDFLQIMVEDTGRGIKEQDQHLIFKPFARIEQKGVVIPGTGLGLDLSRKLARMLDGDIELAWSEVGKGSRFIITLPLTEQGSPLLDESQALKSFSTSEESNLVGALKGKKILLVEDHQDLAELLIIYLEQAGASVHWLMEGSKAVDWVKNHRVDAIVLDLQLRGSADSLSGYYIAAQLRSNGCRAFILAVTAFSTPGHRERSLAVGCNAFLTKPIAADELIGILSESRAQR